MFTQGKTLQRIRQSIHRVKSINFSHDQPAGNYQKIQRQLINAGNDIKKIHTKEINVLEGHQKKNIEKNLIKAMGISPFKYNNIVNPQNYKVQVFTSQSLVPIMHKISTEYIANLIQMQDQIDPTTKQLVKMPSGVPIYQYITECMSKNDTLQLYDSLLASISPLEKKHKNQVFLEPLLKKTLQVLTYFRFVIDRHTLKTILFNELYQHPVTEVQLQQMHKQTVQIANDRAMQYLTEGFSTLKDYMIQLIIMKRASYQIPEKRFFAVVKPQQLKNYDQIIKQALIAQGTSIGYHGRQQLIPPYL